MSYKTVCVAGGGVLGSQIAFQAAYCGFDVTIWLRSEGSIGRTQPKIDHVREEYIAAIEGMADGTGEWCSGIADSGKPFDKEAALAAVERAYSTLKLELDLAKAVADADLVIESMAEDTQAKIDFYKKLAPVLPPKDRHRHQLFHAAAEHLCQVHRPSREVPVAALCQLHLEEQHDRGHGSGPDRQALFR